MDLPYATRCLVALNRQIADLTAELIDRRPHRTGTRPVAATGRSSGPAEVVALQAALQQAWRRRNRLLADPHFPGVADASRWQPAATHALDRERAAVR